MDGLFKKKKGSWLKSSIIARLDSWEKKKLPKQKFDATLFLYADKTGCGLNLFYNKKQTNSKIVVFFEIEKFPSIYFAMQTIMPYEKKFDALINNESVFKDSILDNSNIPSDDIRAGLEYDKERDALFCTLYLNNQSQASNKEISHLMDNVIRWHINIQKNETWGKIYPE